MCVGCEGWGVLRRVAPPPPRGSSAPAHCDSHSEADAHGNQQQHLHSPPGAPGRWWCRRTPLSVGVLRFLQQHRCWSRSRAPGTARAAPPAPRSSSSAAPCLLACCAPLARAQQLRMPKPTRSSQLFSGCAPWLRAFVGLTNRSFLVFTAPIDCFCVWATPALAFVRRVELQKNKNAARRCVSLKTRHYLTMPPPKESIKSYTQQSA